MNKTIKSQRSKAIDTAILKFVKAVEDSSTFKEVINLAPSYENLSKAILNGSSNKDLAKSIIEDLRFMCLLKIKLML